jgi:hypothetical protein
MDQDPASQPTVWRFSWNRWIGVMFGPIPVGLIFAVIVLIAVRS